MKVIKKEGLSYLSTSDDESRLLLIDNNLKTVLIRIKRHLTDPSFPMTLKAFDLLGVNGPISIIIDAPANISGGGPSCDYCILVEDKTNREIYRLNIEACNKATGLVDKTLE